MAKSEIHLSDLVESNSALHSGGPDFYLVYVVLDDGSKFPALFSQYELSHAMQRAVSMPEIAPKWKPTWLYRLTRKFLSLCR